MNDGRERLRRRREKLLNKVFKKELRLFLEKKFGSQGFCQLKFFSCHLKFSVAKKSCQLPNQFASCQNWTIWQPICNTALDLIVVIRKFVNSW